MLDAWIKGLKSSPPDVLVGANFAAFGGVRHHLQAIVRHSSLHVQLAPPDALLESIGAHDLANTFRDIFFAFEPSRVRAIHSHVYPWFIEWCKHNKGKGARWVHTYHLPYFPEHSRGKLEPWQIAFNNSLIGDARHADVLISVAHWQRRYLQTYGIDTIYIPNGVDLTATLAADANRFVSPFGRDPFVLYVGRNDPVKNPSAFVQLAERLPRLRFVMAGRGLSLKTLEDDWGLTTPSNIGVVGELTHSEVLDAIAASSAVVVTSHREGLPTLVLEAMSLSKPIVIPNEQGCMEATAQGEFGQVYQPGDIDDLADKTSRAVGTLGGNAGARDRVAKEYDWSVIAPQLDSIYNGTDA
jgi:glycosyltransferase involved in cell wall biosynthesis